MEIDREKIKQRFSEIQEALKEIGRLVSLDEKEFWSKKENMAAVKYYYCKRLRRSVEFASTLLQKNLIKEFRHLASVLRYWVKKDF